MFAQNKQLQGFSKQLSSIFTENIVKAICFALFTALLAWFPFVYATITSKDYWNYLWTGISGFFLFFTQSYEYTVTSLCLVGLGFLFYLLFRPKKWIYKKKYDQKEHSSSYVSQILKNYPNKIFSKLEFENFCNDFIEDLYSLFTYKSYLINVSWLKPNNNRLELLVKNKKSKYAEDTFSFKAGEGVAGIAWSTGTVQYYSEAQESEHYRTRNSCQDISYLCCPIYQGISDSPYGVISVGFNQDIFIDEGDIETIKLMAIALNTVLETIPDNVKTQLNL
jgi:hypothetical protein